MELVNFIILVALILSGVLNNYFPIKGKKGILLGSIVEEEDKEKEPFSGIIKKYKIYNILACLLGCIFILIGVFLYNEIFQVIGLFTYIGLNFFILAHFNKKVKEAKKEIKTVKKQVAVVNMQSSKISSYMIIYYIFIAITFMAINIIAAVMKYKDLPERIAIHFNASGVADGWTNKSLIAILPLIITILFMILIYIGTDILIQKTSFKIDPKNSEESHKANLKSKKLVSIMMFITMIPVLISLTIGNFVTLTILPESYMKFVMYIPLITLLGVIGLTVVLVKAKNNYKVKNNEVTYKNDDDYWKWGFVYYNKQNPNIFVEKRSGIGVTINAGTKVGMAIYIGIIILLIGSIIAPIIGALLK